MSSPPQQRPNPALVAEQAARCFELKVKGKTYREIGTELGISQQTVMRRIQHEIDSRVSPRVEDYRALQDQQLDALEAEVWAIIEDPATTRAIKLQAIDRMGRLLERRAKLHGVDAPVKVDGTVTVHTQQDAEIEALLAEQAAINEARRQAIESGQG